MDTPAHLMSGADFRESLRQLRPVVYVDGRRIESVADEPALRPGVNALELTYDRARDPAVAPLMLARQSSTGRTVNRMLQVDESAGDLLNKLEAVPLLCQETGCAQRYLAHDGLAALGQAAARLDDASGRGECRDRFQAYLDHVQAGDLALGIAMTDGKGDRSLRPGLDGTTHLVISPLEFMQRLAAPVPRPHPAARSLVRDACRARGCFAPTKSRRWKSGEGRLLPTDSARRAAGLRNIADLQPESLDGSFLADRRPLRSS